LREAPEPNGLALAGGAQIFVDRNRVDAANVSDERSLFGALLRVEGHQDAGKEGGGQEEVARLPEEVAGVGRDDETLEAGSLVDVPNFDELDTTFYNFIFPVVVAAETTEVSVGTWPV
jgi:hypothetical protein